MSIMVDMMCPRCGKETVKSGFVLRAGGKKQRYQCKECGYCFIEKKGEDVA